MQSWNTDGDGETFIPVLPLHHPNPRPLLVSLADLQLVDTGTAILLIFATSVYSAGPAGMQFQLLFTLNIPTPRSPPLLPIFPFHLHP